MAFTRSGREKYLLSIGVFRLPADYSFLPLPRRTLQLIVTNLRNRPLNRIRVESLRDTVMSLYHHLITGSRDFPEIPFRGPIRTRQDFTPFVPEEHRENFTYPSLEAPPGMMATPANYTSRTILTPTLPEWVELRALWGDSRNRVHSLMVDGRMINRVISPVYGSDLSELTNRWRISDYAESGFCLMSVLCRFTAESTRCVQRPKKRKRRSHEEDEDEESSSQSQPKKRLRV